MSESNLCLCFVFLYCLYRNHLVEVEKHLNLHPKKVVLPEKEHQLTGIYDLVAVLTHKGRSADSGHYVAWVKQENGQFNWEEILF